jgi:hypothetical protein
MTDDLDRAFEIATDPPRKRRKKPEAKIQAVLVTWLRERGVICAITDAGVLNKLGLQMSCGIPTGWPDITCCLPQGRFLGIECKAARGRQTPAQEWMQKNIEANGGLYILARSVEELAEAISWVIV